MTLCDHFLSHKTANLQQTTLFRKMRQPKRLQRAISDDFLRRKSAEKLENIDVDALPRKKLHPNPFSSLGPVGKCEKPKSHETSLEKSLHKKKRRKEYWKNLQKEERKRTRARYLFCGLFSRKFLHFEKIPNHVYFCKQIFRIFHKN